MKKLKSVLFYVSPFHSHGIPLDLATGAVDKLAEMSKALKSKGVAVEVLTSGNAAKAMKVLRKDVFASCDAVHALANDVFAMASNGHFEQAGEVFEGKRESGIDISTFRTALIEEGVGDGFDLVISLFTDTVYLKLLFPKSKVSFFETGLVCHQPFKQFHSFDTLGSFSRSSFVGHRTNTFSAEQVGELELYRPILEQIRAGMVSFSAHYYPLAPDLHGLRAKWKKIYMVAGQPFGRSSLDQPFNKTFDLVEHVLRCVPRDSAVLLTEHPSFPQITAPQHKYLSESYSNYVYSENLQALYSPSAICLPIVDAVIGVSSTVLLHGHALGLCTHALGSNCFARLNASDTLAEFVQSVEDERPLASKETDILDLIARYSVPMGLYQTEWLVGYLERLLNCAEGELPTIASAPDLLPHYDLREFPSAISKTQDFFQFRWSSAPLSLVEPPVIPRKKSRSAHYSAKKYTVATVLDHYAIGGTQNVIRRLVDLLPNVYWVIFVEKRVAEEYVLSENCEIIEIGSIGDTENLPERKLSRAVYDFHSMHQIDTFVNPMHWRAATLRALPLIKEICDIPVIYWEHNSFFFPMYTAKPILHELREEVAQIADRVILLSEYDRWHFATYFPTSQNEVILNPVPEPDDKKVLSFAKDKTVLVVGRFDPQKRMDRIPVIAEAFLSQHPDWNLIVLGDGYLKTGVEQAVMKTTVSDRVQFSGYQSDPSTFFEKASIFASLSDYEGDPLTFLEAKAAGLPIVSFELFQNTKLRDGIDGFSVPQGDITQFADRLSQLAKDPLLRKKMALEGHKHYLSFDNQTVADAWMTLLDSLASGKPFTPKPPEAPSSKTLQREALHVAQSVHRFMEERLKQVRASSAVKPQVKIDPAPQPARQKTGPRAAIQPPRISTHQLVETAKTHLRNGKHNEAIPLLERAVSDQPDRASFKRFLAEAYLAKGDRLHAVRQLEDAVTLNPKNKNLRRRLKKAKYPLRYFWASDTPFEG